MVENKLAAIVLAAGLGTRMNSKNAKVLYKIKGKPMILRTLEVAVNIAGLDTIVVIGYQAEVVKQIISDSYDVKFAYQKKQIGTGNAVLCSIPLLPNKAEDIVILCADVPLLTSRTVHSLVQYHRKNKNDITVLATKVLNPKGYGRILLNKNGDIYKIIEENDATDKEKKITLVNTGIFCVKKSCIILTLNGVKRDNVKNEMYLTDIIKVGYNYGLKLGVHISSNNFEMVGVNTMEELIRAEVLYDTNAVN